MRLPQSLASPVVGQTQLSREALSERQRERIMEVATEVFAKRGYQAATIDNIVNAAKIGFGSFYEYFEGKEDCLLQIWEALSADVHERIAVAVRDKDDWADQALAGLQAVIDFAAEEPLAARVALREAQTGGPAVVSRFAAMVDEIADFLRSGRNLAGFDPPPPPSFEEATANGIIWLVQGRLAYGELGNGDSLFAEVAEVAFAPYLGPARLKARIAARLNSTPA